MDITMNLRSVNMKPSKPAPAIGSSHDSLFAELREMIAASRTRLASTVNRELTRLYWTIGERLRREELGGERAAYGAKVVARQGEKLAAEFGRGFEAKNLRRMIQFSRGISRTSDCRDTVATIELEPIRLPDSAPV